MRESLHVVVPSPKWNLQPFSYRSSPNQRIGHLCWGNQRSVKVPVESSALTNVLVDCDTQAYLYNESGIFGRSTW